MEGFPKPEKKKEGNFTPPTPEQMEIYNRWREDNPDEPIPIEMRRDYEKEKTELEELLARYKQGHPLENLHAISEVSPELYAVFQNAPGKSVEIRDALMAKLSQEDKEKYFLRGFAISDLKPITALLNKLHDETNIPSEEYERLKEEYKTLSRAVGMLSGGKIDHTR